MAKTKKQPKDDEKKQAETEIIAQFWAVPDDALFTREEVAVVRRYSLAKLDREAWLGVGIKFVRDGGRCLYPKKNVKAYLQTLEASHAA
jgi:hypothetical protein